MWDQRDHHMLIFFGIVELNGQRQVMYSKMCGVDISFCLKRHGE